MPTLNLMLIEFNYPMLGRYGSSFIKFQFSAISEPLSNQLTTFQFPIFSELLPIHPASKNCSAAGQLRHKRRGRSIGGESDARRRRGASRRVVTHVLAALWRF